MMNYHAAAAAFAAALLNQNPPQQMMQPQQPHLAPPGFTPPQLPPPPTPPGMMLKPADFLLRSGYAARFGQPGSYMSQLAIMANLQQQAAAAAVANEANQ